MSTLWSGSWSKIKENSRLRHDSPNTNTQERLEKLLTCKTPGARFRERSPEFNSINQEEIMDWRLCPRSWNQFFISFFLIGHQHLHIWMYIWWWFYQSAAVGPFKDADDESQRSHSRLWSCPERFLSHELHVFFFTVVYCFWTWFFWVIQPHVIHSFYTPFTSIHPSSSA